MNQAVMPPSVTTIPGTDETFREHVRRLIDRHGIQTPEGLGERLVRMFPRVIVRASEVSGLTDRWYVYRDGVWRSDTDAAWWNEPRTPRVVVSTDGWIEEANAPARALLGLSAADEMPRFFADFGAPGTAEDAAALFGLVAAGHELSITTLVRPTSGDVIACDLRVWHDAGRILGALRLADDIPAQPGAPRAPVKTLVCHPVADTLFARYAADALSRMPEPTPDGLTLRLRRLFPHARVEAGEGAWEVFRDATRIEGQDDRWWRADGLAAVQYDGQGRILTANTTAEALLGRDLVGRHWQELVTAGTTDQVAAVLAMIAEVGWAESRFRMPGADGYLFEFDSYTEVTGETFVTIMRRRDEGAQGTDGIST